MNDFDKAMLGSNLEGQLLIAMPGMSDPRFARSVVYMCAHSDEGAMGLVINQPIDDLTFGELIEQIDALEDDEAVEMDGGDASWPVHTGGPMESSRGFVLHSPDYFSEDATTKITTGVCLTATTDILRAMATGGGPARALVALGYASWAPGQLESELGANVWLNGPADPELVLAVDSPAKYDRALTKLGVNPSHLVTISGRA
jgi:putative transcriptional regulator